MNPSHYAQHPAFQQMTPEQLQHLYNQPGALSIADHAAFYGQTPGQLTCDVKPRLSKEQHDILEAHYRNQAKPNTNTKRGFAENLGVSLDKVNVGDCSLS